MTNEDEMTDKYYDREITLNNGERMTVREFLAIRKEEGLNIDPSTAEVTWWYTQVLDPYGIDPDLPDECYCVGRSYFARRPGGDICVEFGDLPEKAGRHKSELAFPAGLEGLETVDDSHTSNRILIVQRKRTDDADTVATNAHGAGGLHLSHEGDDAID